MSTPTSEEIAWNNIRAYLTSGKITWAREVFSSAISEAEQRGKLAGRIEGLEEAAKHRSIPDCAICFFKDGDKWQCVFGDFINLQESPAGFGNNFSEALDDLEKQRKEPNGKTNHH